MSLDDLNEGFKPGHGSLFGSYGSSSDYSTTQYKEDLKKFRKMALDTQELGSSEYSGNTSEPINPSSSSTEGQHTTQEMETSKVEKETKDDVN